MKQFLIITISTLLLTGCMGSGGCKFVGSDCHIQKPILGEYVFEGTSKIHEDDYESITLYTDSIYIHKYIGKDTSIIYAGYYEFDVSEVSSIPNKYRIRFKNFLATNYALANYLMSDYWIGKQTLPMDEEFNINSPTKNYLFKRIDYFRNMYLMYYNCNEYVIDHSPDYTSQVYTLNTFFKKK